MDATEVAIDEGLYSRQLYVLGHEAAMKRIAASNVLIVGAQGLGAEVAKNVVLAGVKSVTIYDPELVKKQDLATQFLLREGDVGEPRAKAAVRRLAELNANVCVKELGGTPGAEITTNLIQGFEVIVLCGVVLGKQLKINDWTHRNGVHFISADACGLFGCVFNDFGPEFACIDPTGEEPLTGMIVSVEKNEEGTAHCSDETKHGLQNGDFVTFSEVQGMLELNGCEPRKITVKDPHAFGIGDTSRLGDYISGGIFTQVKKPKTIQFKSLRESLKSPTFFIPDFAKPDHPATLHAGFQALAAFEAQHQRLPRPRNVEDAQSVLTMAKNLNAEIDEKIIAELAFQAVGDLAPIITVIGAFVAQEILKACSARFHPMVQHMYFDSMESLPSPPPTETDCQLIGSRYDGQIAVFGKAFQEKIAAHRQFLVGLGGIGCEMLKNWSMMGLGAGSQGVIHVADPGTIKKSNLNRMLLFRPTDIGKSKVEVVADAVAAMNPDMRRKVLVKQESIGPDMSNVYSDEFFAEIDCITSAVDNIKARSFMDLTCVLFETPLLVTGAKDTRGNVQVIMPRLTELYASLQDSPERIAPVCGLPNVIEHAIEWGRMEFDRLFVMPAQAVDEYLSIPNYLESKSEYSGQIKERAEELLSHLVTHKPRSFDDCITWARLQFERKYNNDIHQLLLYWPKDSLTGTGQLFWSGAKREPQLLTFNSNNPTHFQYIMSAANLHALNYGLQAVTSEAVIHKAVDSVIVPDFTPRRDIELEVDQKEQISNTDSGEDLNDLLKQLPSRSSLPGYRLNVAKFEMEDDTNYHIDFVTAASNLRAANFRIPTTDRYKVKQISGKITPAIVTTTALVAGLACLELYKIINGKNKLEHYKNSCVDLALPSFGLSIPEVARKDKHGGNEWTRWDRFEFTDDPRLKHLIDWFKDNHQLDVVIISQGVRMLWSAFMKKEKSEERISANVSRAVELVSKTTIPPHVKRLIVDIMATDENGEDVEVPFLVVWL